MFRCWQLRSQLASPKTPPLSSVAVVLARCTANPLSSRTSSEVDVHKAPEPEESPPAVRGADVAAFLVFENPAYERMVNMMMKQGKKQIARNLLWDTFTRLRQTGSDPQSIFSRAVENVRPMVEVRTMKSRSNQQVPMPLTPHRSEGLAMKWLVSAARKRKQAGGMGAKLHQELLQAADNKGNAVARRDAMHQLALANQAAAHFRWSRSSGRTLSEVDMDRKSFRPQGRRAIRRLQAPF
mmetsp:Transcript_66455/g.110509  ORF Transcript_66455/g.110509 Transcript_66455/m.110509 type:complete len:239 (-) Transcript_66455:160-876(-)